MTTVGHSLMGMAIAVACLPSDFSKTARTIGFLSFIVLANLPDAPLSGWGHDRYDISHSLFVNSCFIALFILGASIWCQGQWSWTREWRVAVGAASAWLSHLLLDTFYNHGRGLAMFWPVSEAHLALPIPWFKTLHGSSSPFIRHSMNVFGIECLAYGTFLLLVLAWRYRLVKLRTW